MQAAKTCETGCHAPDSLDAYLTGWTVFNFWWSCAPYFIGGNLQVIISTGNALHNAPVMCAIVSGVIRSWSL